MSNKKLDNDYNLFPIHKKGASYFGKYEGRIESGELRSISGVSPTGSVPIADFRDAAQAVGDKYFNDWQQWNIIQLLMTAYFGTTNNDLYFADIDGSKANTGTYEWLYYCCRFRKW